MKANVNVLPILPTNTPLIKINRTKSYGAEVVLYGDVYDDACEHALKLAEEHGYTFIHAFNDLDVACGQGSIAMDIIKDSCIQFAPSGSTPITLIFGLSIFANVETPVHSPPPPIGQRM